MTTRTLARRDPDLDGAKVLVVGLARSGAAAAKLALARGARVTVVDRRVEAELGQIASELRDRGAGIAAGGHDADRVHGVDLVVVSPGVPETVAEIEAALRQGVPVWSEVELAARYCAGRVIGITGSNGKSTVTSMVGQILRRAGYAGGTGGNLDVPFCELLNEDAPEAVHALELSSFQLEHCHTLRPHVAEILNVTPDHMDRYRCFEDYVEAKLRLLSLQESTDATILNADDAVSDSLQDRALGRLHSFSTRGEVDRGAFVRSGQLVLRTEAGEETFQSVDALPVPGEHNLANALAAGLACRLIGCSLRDITDGLGSFRALPHRLERVAELGGVTFYNDSKATNPAAAIRGLTSFPQGEVLLILGGYPKGADWSELIPVVVRHARCVFLVGQAAETLEELLRGRVEVVRSGAIHRAVPAAFAAARPGQTVLLSPACASFDQYRDFEERGEDFRRAVHRLRGEVRDA